MSTDFITALTKQLRAWQDETQWLQPDVIAEMLRDAANEAVGKLSRVEMYRQWDPIDSSPQIILKVETDSVLMWPEDVATLRALLMSFDENAPARVGEPLSMPARLTDGRVVSVVVEEMLKESNDD